MFVIAGLALVFCFFSSAIASGAAADTDTLDIGGGKIHLALSPDLPLPRADVVGWVRRAAVAVSHYLGRFPVKQVTITIKRGGGGAIGGGVTYAGARIIVRLGRSTTLTDLQDDWIMTHEMFHLAFPTMPQRQAWMMEGLSDYLEPLARAQVGQLTTEQVWNDMVHGMPQGLPEEGDEGLDNTHTWGRTYWGGDIFWLLADVQIRLQTNNRHNLGDAIRAILADGGNGGSEWTLDRVLKVGDRATGTTVLKDLHNELGPRPGNVDLPDLWKKLGISTQDDSVRFDNSAPWANIRQAITSDSRHSR